MKNKEQFINLLRSTKREGIEDLIAYLETTDFFTAPASTQYHGAEAEGLVIHSLAVEQNIHKIAATFTGALIAYSAATLTLVALTHDICKAEFYKVSTRNVKDDETGKWSKVPFYAIEDLLPMGHGEKSLYILMKFIKLSDEEAAAIRWHMGGYDDAARQYGGGQCLTAACKKWPLITALHMADIATANFDHK